MAIKVGVLRGGPSNEYEVSLKTGENVLRCLPREKYEGIDLILNRDGYLSANNSPVKIQHLDSMVDVVFNALHGYFGEDGKMQQILNVLNMPYTGSGALASALAMNKVLSRNIFEKAGLRIPRAIIVKNDEQIDEAALRIFRSMNPLWVVKPASGGSSIGINIARNFQELIKSIENAFNFDSTIIVEEYIKGRETTCGILENFRGEEYYALPPIEIVVSDNHKFFNYEAKYNDTSTKEICPANFEISIKREIENVARLAHQVLGCKGYSRADMIVSDKGIYLLEINTLPGQTTASLIQKSAEAIGLYFPQLLEHIIDSALNRNRK